jgi:hypothetical protein
MRLSSKRIEEVFDMDCDVQTKVLDDKVNNSNDIEKQNFLKTQELTCQAVELLHQKAKFLQEMLLYELEDQEHNLTCEPYPYKTELRFVTFKLTLELKEVIEIFSA